jgi:hypothetical protein
VDNVAQFTESLRDDLAAWTKATEIPPLNKHASQVAAIVLQLTEALASLGELKDSQPVNVLEQAIGDYLHIWDFFRTKLAMRFVPWYQPLTAAADDLAWAAFGPVRAAAHDRMKRELREPPLVYYSREVIPFTVTRGQNYQNLLPRGGLWTEQSEAVADNLVVPVVSLPWQRFTSLSVLLSVPHEVGHVLVSDLDLLPILGERLAAADVPQSHQPIWSAWLEEVFADVFGAVVCGGSVALSLVGQLGTDSASASSLPTADAGPLRWGEYPPVALRAKMILHVAERRADLRDQPRPLLPDGGPAEFDDDVEAVASALLDGEIPQIAGRLEDLYQPVDGPALRDDIGRLSRGRNPQAGDVRIVIAAAATVEHASPAEYARYSVHDLALTRATKIRDTTRRGRDPKQASIDERDRQAGRTLAGLLTSHGADP